MFHFLLIGTSWSRTSSVVACSEIASSVPISAPARGISGATPDVDSVMRRRDSDSPSPSIATSIASRTPSKLYSGSPMPISTTLESIRFSGGFTPATGHSPRSSRHTRIWPTISAGVRLRTSFCVPVWQNEQVSVQPT